MMSFDSYALCPGGREKKIRFCCNELQKEIEQIEKLLESGQTGACLSYIENVEKNHPGKACLTAAKGTVYRNENRWQEALTLAQSFYQQEPNNPVAASDYALALALNGKPQDAVSVVIDAFESAKEGTAHSSVISATLQIGAALLLYRQVVPVIAIGNQLKNFPSAEEPANALLYRASSYSEFPILLRDLMFESACLADFPGQKDFDEAVALVTLMRWKSALKKFESLTQYAGQWAFIWRNIAAVRFWLLDNEGGKEALRQFVKAAQEQSLDIEDIVDAETTLLHTAVDPFGDQTSLVEIEYTITDAPQAREKILSTPVFQQVALQNNSSENSPPPINTFIILDKPFPPKDNVTLQTAASQIAAAFLYGKETDRNARLVIAALLEDQRFDIEKVLGEALGGLVNTSGNVLNRQNFSRSAALVQCRFRFSRETMLDVEIVRKLENSYYNEYFPDAWCKLPLGFLDGKTPAEAAADGHYTVKLAAAIQLLESLMTEETGMTVGNSLRAKLGVPLHGQIGVPDGSAETLFAVLDELPIWRWYRLDVEKLPTDVLAEGLQILGIMNEPLGLVRFAKEILNRKMDSMKPELRVVAFEFLIRVLAHSDAEEALLWIERAKNEAQETKQSDAYWYLTEIPIRIRLGQGTEVERSIQYIVRNYGRDAEVMMALRTLYIELGILNPDGTPNAALQRQSGTAPEPSQTIPSQKIWTPESTAAGTASKLWTPD